MHSLTLLLGVIFVYFAACIDTFIGCNIVSFYEKESKNMHIIEDLWNGRLSPVEQSFRYDDTYKQQQQILLDCEEQLMAHLGDAGRDVFFAYEDAESAIHCRSQCSSFVFGFRLGALLMQEIFHPPGDPE